MNLPDLILAKKRTRDEVKKINYKLNKEFKNIWKNMKYYVKTYGCQMNEHDSENIEGWEVNSPPPPGKRGGSPGCPGRKR